MFIDEVWRKYQADKTIEGYSPLTLRMYSYQSNLLKRYIGKVAMEDITTNQLKAYLIERGGHLKPSSLILLKHLFA